jgi:hypothetical protein
MDSASAANGDGKTKLQLPESPQTGGMVVMVWAPGAQRGRLRVPASPTVRAITCLPSRVRQTSLEFSRIPPGRAASGRPPFLPETDLYERSCPSVSRRLMDKRAVDEAVSLQPSLGALLCS